MPQKVPSRIASIEYEMITDSDKANPRLELLHENIHKYGTVYNSVAPGTTWPTRSHGRRKHAFNRIGLL